MRFFTRFKGAMLNKSKDPSENIDQYLREAEKGLGEAKAEIAAVMEEELRCKRELDACMEEIEKLQQYAEKAGEAGDERDVSQFLERKEILVNKAVVLQEALTAATAKTDKVRELHDKLVNDLESLNARRADIKSKLGN